MANALSILITKHLILTFIISTFYSNSEDSNIVTNTTTKRSDGHISIPAVRVIHNDTQLNRSNTV